MRAAGDTLGPEGREVASAVFERACSDRSIDALGNARFVRNVYDKAAESRALRHEHSRIESLSRAELSAILPDDIVYASDALVGTLH